MWPIDNNKKHKQIKKKIKACCKLYNLKKQTTTITAKQHKILMTFYTAWVLQKKKIYKEETLTWILMFFWLSLSLSFSHKQKWSRVSNGSSSKKKKKKKLLAIVMTILSSEIWQQKSLKRKKFLQSMCGKTFFWIKFIFSLILFKKNS